MFKMTKSDSEIQYGVKEFVCDTIEDLKNLPRCEMGSSAIILSESSVYVKNGAGKWVKL
jgi:hypothetical protein